MLYTELKKKTVKSDRRGKKENETLPLRFEGLNAWEENGGKGCEELRSRIEEKEIWKDEEGAS